MSRTEVMALPNRGLVSNTRWNFVAFGCTLAAHFVTLPFVVRWLGLKAFGEAGLIIALWAPLTVAGTVVGQAVTREMSDRLSRTDATAAAQVFDAARLLSVTVCLIGLLLLVALGPPLLVAFGPAGLADEPLRTLFVITGLGWAAQQLALVYQGACAAHQNFALIARVSAYSAVATVTCTLGLTAAIGSTGGYLAGVALSLVLTLIVWVVVVRVRPRGRRWWGRPEPSALSSIIHFGKWQTAAQLAGSLGNQADRYALGVLAPATVVGQYNAANRLQEAAYMGVMKIGEVLFPHFGATAHHSAEERREFFLTSSWVVLTLSVALLAPMVPLSHSLLALWVGAETANGGSLLLRTLVLGGIVGCGSNVFCYCAMGLGRTDMLAWLALMYSVITIAGTIAFVAWFGPVAAGVGLLVASVARVAVSMHWTRSKLFLGLLWQDIAVSTLLPLLIGVVLALGLQAIGAGDVSSWWSLALAYAIGCVLVLAAVVSLTACSAQGRNILTGVHTTLRRMRGLA